MLTLRFYSRCDKDSVPPFLIEWYTSDTTVSINLLRREIVDLGITYHSIAEQAALEDGIVDRVEYAWRDHWMLVGISFRKTLSIVPLTFPQDRSLTLQACLQMAKHPSMY